VIPGIVYLVSLVVGGGVLATQLLMSGHGEASGGDAGGGDAGGGDAGGADAGGGDAGHGGSGDAGELEHAVLHDAQYDVDAYVAAPSPAHAPGDASALSHSAGHPAGKDVVLAKDWGALLGAVLSLRFWSFALFAFGFVGSVLHFFGLAAGLLTALVAVVAGLGAGGFSVLLFRLLTRAATQSGAEPADAVGQVGRVLVPILPGQRGKVRLRVKGQDVDYLATSDGPLLEAGARVLIEDLRDGEAQVSRAPFELE
jgi:membrane protein implicated in regulation of membrane protease activity